jgi:hypothetical protein
VQELILSNVVHVSCDATDPFGLREQLFEFCNGLSTPFLRQPDDYRMLNV